MLMPFDVLGFLLKIPCQYLVPEPIYPLFIYIFWGVWGDWGGVGGSNMWGVVTDKGGSHP